MVDMKKIQFFLLLSYNVMIIICSINEDEDYYEDY